MQASPYKDTADNFLANAASFSLAAVYLCSLMFKMAALTELDDILERMSPEQRNDYYVPADIISGILLFSVFGALGLSVVLLLSRLTHERIAMEREQRTQKARRLRDKSTHREVTVQPVPDQPKRHFHTFLSHVW